MARRALNLLMNEVSSFWRCEGVVSPCLGAVFFVCFIWLFFLLFGLFLPALPRRPSPESNHTYCHATATLYTSCAAPPWFFPTSNLALFQGVLCRSRRRIATCNWFTFVFLFRCILPLWILFNKLLAKCLLKGGIGRWWMERRRPLEMVRCRLTYNSLTMICSFRHSKVSIYMSYEMF